MGFSVSGSMVIVLLGLFIAAGAMYGSLSNTMEAVSDAREDRDDAADRLRHTDVQIDGVTLLSNASCSVAVTATNAGDTDLALNRTDLLFDNEYRAGWQADATVDGDAGTDLWLPGESLTVEVTGLVTAPDRIRLVSGPGVADATEVSGLAC